MKKIIISVAITFGLMFSMSADTFTLEEVFKTEKEELVAKKRVAHLENMGVWETKYFDYYSERLNKEIAFISYEFDEENISVLREFLISIGENKEIKSKPYTLEIQYVVGMGMLYKVEEV